MKNTLLLGACLSVLVASASRLGAQTTEANDNALVPTAPHLNVAWQAGEEKPKKVSPWLLLPVVSSGPKMGTSFGGVGARLHYFDPQSQLSIFGVMYQYSTTHSQVGGAFARTSFGADRHRLDGFVGFGKVENEYEDYMGTGQPFRTTDDIRMAAGRYLYRLKGGWFLGTETAFANYNVTGKTPTDTSILEMLGITGFNGGGVGLVVMHDSRDNQDMPAKGWYANLNNLANRTWLGAEGDYGIYRLEVKGFLEHGGGHVFGVRTNSQFTSHAPVSAESTIELRGYKMEEYLGRYMTSFEAEERIRFSRRFGATLFGGAAVLYGGSRGPINNDGWYPSYGGGFHFVVKPEDHMLLNLEYAHAKQSAYGIYLKIGYSW